MFSVGDLIDRGPESESCLTLLDEPWFNMIRGNHEQMCIEACRPGGGDSWWASYGSWAKWISPSDMENWCKKFEALPISMTIDCNQFAVGLCHAEPDGQDWINSRENTRSESVMLWGRKVLNGDIQYNVEGVDITIHGHTPLEAPKWVGNRYFIDTGAWNSGVLTLRKISDIYEEHIEVKNLFG